MRNSRFWVLVILGSSLLSCSKDSTEPASTLSNSPEAVASENTKSGGVYKGVLVGSSGYFTIVLQGGQKQIRVTMDGETRTLTTTALESWSSGDLIKNALFVADDWQATFSVGIAGSSPSANFTIPGHPNLQAVVLKELSNAQVRAYEGQYSGSSSGTWNFIVQGQAMTGVSRSADGGTAKTFYGLVDGNSIVLDVINGSGTISGDNVSGSWSDPGTGGTGTWTGKRSM